MRLNPKYFRVRLTLLLAPLFALTMARFSYSVIAKYLTTSEELNHARAIIDRFDSYTFTEGRLIGPDKVYTYFNIYLRDQPYSIELSDENASGYWSQITQEYSAGDTVQFLYPDHRLRENVLHNPEELKINGHTIIHFENNRTAKMWASLFLLFVVFLFGSITLLAYKTYKEVFWNGDKLVYQNSKWRFFKRWFSES